MTYYKLTSRRTQTLLIAVGLMLGSAVTALAQAPLPYVDPLFTDNVVLQRDQPDNIWGWTTPGATVTVSVEGKTAKAVAGSDGKWDALIGPLKPGGPFPLTIGGPQNVTLNNVEVGDVWLCSGQSNMEFGVGNAVNGAQEIAAANYPNIRIFTVNKSYTSTPQTLTSGQWQPVTPSSIQNQGTWNGFSAVAYFFGRDLQQAVHVPIGLIQSSWGGTPAEAWTSSEALTTNLPVFAPQIAALPTAAINQNYPATLYNGMIAPILTYNIEGALWYQGESNAGNALQYRTLLPTMITDWRTRWNEGNFPFLIVQLAGWQPGGGAWPELRQAQWLTAQNLPNTGIVTAIDIGNQTDIHPKNKQEVGRRLALVAEATVYGKKVAYSGPVYKSIEITGSSVSISFMHVDGGLTAQGGTPLLGFEVAGADGNFVTANARISGKSVIVSSPSVTTPVAVQYDWSGFPSGNLYNGAGLPAFPFKTDER